MIRGTRDRIESRDLCASIDPTNHVFLAPSNDRTETAGKQIVALAFYRQQLLEKKRRVDGSDSTTIRVETGTHNVNDWSGRNGETLAGPLEEVWPQPPDGCLPFNLKRSPSKFDGGDCLGIRSGCSGCLRYSSAFRLPSPIASFSRFRRSIDSAICWAASLMS